MLITAYLVLLVLTNIRFFVHSGVLCFPIPAPKPLKRRLYEGKILVQYPVMNEPLELIKRFINSLHTIPEHQRNQFLLQVLDDYKEPLKPDLFENCPTPFEIVRRSDRSGMDPNYPGKAKSKAGNMNNGLRRAGPEFKYVAIYDVDHQVQDYGKMVEASSMLEANDDLWCIQSRWIMDNLSWNWLSLLQQGIMNMHIDREQLFRARHGLVSVLNGAGAVISLEKVRREFGFWLERAITEDLDISYEFHTRGQRVHVDPEWTTKIDNPKSLTALRDQWSKWSKSNGQLLQFHRNLKHPSKLIKAYWLSWMAGFGVNSTKYLFLAVSLFELIRGMRLHMIELLCIIPHICAWIAASQTWNNKLEIRRIISYPLLYVLEWLILDIQIRSFWVGLTSYNKEHEFKPTPK